MPFTPLISFTASSPESVPFRQLIAFTAYSLEAAGVSVIVLGGLLSSITFLRTFRRLPVGVAYKNYRRHFGLSIVLGLEFLVAGDIIRTIVDAHTVENVAVLGLVVLIRSFLSATLHLEIEGRWPWQTKNHS